MPGRCRQVAVWACGWRPPTPRAGNEPQKNGFLPQKHLLSEAFAVGVSARQVSRKKPAKRRCCSASARSETGLKSLSEERGEKEKREKKRTYVCYSFIQSHALCQSSFTSLGASGKAAQKQSLLLERTRLVLLRHLGKA